MADAKSGCLKGKTPSGPCSARKASEIVLRHRLCLTVGSGGAMLTRAFVGPRSHFYQLMRLGSPLYRVRMKARTVQI